MNKSQKSHRNRRLLITGIAIVALFGLVGWSFTSGMYSSMSSGNWPTEFQSNGERIYFTGTSASGLAIYGRGENMHMTMMSGNTGCVACHGANRQGGRLMHRFWKNAPSLTADALFGEHREDNHGDHDGYSDETLRRAITHGVDAGGDRLDSDMPKWVMSEQDIGDLIAFLKTSDNSDLH